MKFKLIIISILCCLGIGLWLLVNFKNEMKRPLVMGNSVSIEIHKGDSFARITEKLKAQHLPIKSFWFKLLAYQGHAFKRIKTGEYEFPVGVTLPDIIVMLVAGKTKQYAITFPEGWTFRQIYHAIVDNPHIEHTQENPEALMNALQLSPTHPEGQFFPDTYFFEKHTRDVDLLQRAYKKMQAVIAQEWQRQADQLPYKTPYEVLIMASIIEKETAAENERSQIAGVFIRRLQQGMRLQTDPTVIYGMGEAYQGNLTTKDLKTLTPYNTYLINGLPPTPIAMPGRDAIHAALHPDLSDNIYFVARGDGSHVFSANLPAHNEAVNQYQRKQK